MEPSFVAAGCAVLHCLFFLRAGRQLPFSQRRNLYQLLDAGRFIDGCVPDESYTGLAVAAARIFPG